MTACSCCSFYEIVRRAGYHRWIGQIHHASIRRIAVGNSLTGIDCETNACLGDDRIVPEMSETGAKSIRSSTNDVSAEAKLVID